MHWRYNTLILRVCNTKLQKYLRKGISDNLQCWKLVTAKMCAVLSPSQLLCLHLHPLLVPAWGSREAGAGCPLTSARQDLQDTWEIGRAWDGVVQELQQHPFKRGNVCGLCKMFLSALASPLDFSSYEHSLLPGEFQYFTSQLSINFTFLLGSVKD